MSSVLFFVPFVAFELEIIVTGYWCPLVSDKTSVNCLEVTERLFLIVLFVTEWRGVGASLWWLRRIPMVQVARGTILSRGTARADRGYHPVVTCALCFFVSVVSKKNVCPLAPFVYL